MGFKSPNSGLNSAALSYNDHMKQSVIVCLVVGSNETAENSKSCWICRFFLGSSEMKHCHRLTVVAVVFKDRICCNHTY